MVGVWFLVGMPTNRPFFEYIRPVCEANSPIGYLLQVHINRVFPVETIILITMLKFKKVPIQYFPGNLQMCKKNFLAIQRCHIKHIWIIYMTFKTRCFQIQLGVQPLSVSDFEKPCKPMHLVALGW